MATVESVRTASRHEALASDAPQLVGRLGPWQLVKPLGEGNLTRVYLARPADGPQNQPAAYVVKVLRKEWWRDPLAIEMQRREAAHRGGGNVKIVLPTRRLDPAFESATCSMRGTATFTR